MSEIKVNKVSSALNPLKVSVEPGLEVKNTSLSEDNQTSFVANSSGVKFLGPIFVGNEASNTAGIRRQVLSSRGKNLSPQWVDEPNSLCGDRPLIGTLWGVGANNTAQLGQGNTFPTYTNFKQIGSTAIWISISPGGSHTLGIKQDGTLWAWGLNDKGQLGDNTTTTRTSPVKIGSETNWSRVFAGLGFSAAVKTDGSLYVWGSNDWGQLGTNRPITDTQKIPVRVGTDFWQQIEIGIASIIGIKQNGTLWAWGQNNFQSLGLNTTTTTIKVPTQVGSDSDWLQVSQGNVHGMGIKTNKHLWGWGSNSQGQLGDRTTVTATTPKLISNSFWKEISCGSGFSVGIQDDGTLWSSGGNSFSQLGVPSSGPNDKKLSFEKVGTDDNWDSISCGDQCCVALKLSGTMWVWGLNDKGQLGTGNVQTITTPTQTGKSIIWARAAMSIATGFMIGVGNELLVVPVGTIALFIRTGYTDVIDTLTSGFEGGCPNGTPCAPNPPPAPPTGWKYCDGTDGTPDLRFYLNPFSSSGEGYTFPPLFGYLEFDPTGCGFVPGSRAGQMCYIIKTEMV